MEGYDDHLDRALDESPDVEGNGERFDAPDPDVRQEGNVTVYENFQAALDRFDREADHLLKFLQDELGTSAHIDESGRARLTGEFGRARIEAALEAYAEAFVLCPECRLPDTRFEREQGALSLRCEACGARSPASE